MATYTERDLRAVDRLALLLFGVGIVLLARAVLAALDGATKPLLWIGAVTALSLGTALILKLRQLARNRNSDDEPPHYDDVFE